MKHAEIGGIEFEYPDGFIPLTEDEICRYYFSAKNRWAARAAEQHTIISLGWTKTLNGLTSFLVSQKTFRDNYEKQNRKSLKSFKREEGLSFEICGTKADGFDFSYEAIDTGTAQNGKLLTFTLAKQIYLVECISNSANKAFGKETFEAVLRSIRIK
ncbi:MAG: hypothetical protein K6B74_03950 [Ruminococcus sp.]|nr:hypothetical protein [Ruminococcus sp.]